MACGPPACGFCDAFVEHPRVIAPATKAAASKLLNPRYWADSASICSPELRYWKSTLAQVESPCSWLATAQLLRTSIKQRESRLVVGTRNPLLVKAQDSPFKSYFLAVDLFSSSISNDVYENSRFTAFIRCGSNSLAARCLGEPIARTQGIGECSRDSWAIRANAGDDETRNVCPL